MTITPFLVFYFGVWASGAREKQATGRFDKTCWQLVNGLLIVAAIVSLVEPQWVHFQGAARG